MDRATHFRLNVEERTPYSKKMIKDHFHKVVPFRILKGVGCSQILPLFVLTTTVPRLLVKSES